MIEALAKTIEHTLLQPTATRAMIDRHCAEARTYEMLAVCVNPQWVGRAVDILMETGVKVVTVVGFPLGASATVVKAFECEYAVRQGADEIDMVVQLGPLKAGDRFTVCEDIRTVVKAAAGRPVKVILETALLSDPEKRLCCALAEEAGARFVKTSTGFGPGGATVEDVRLLAEATAGRLGVKASGGIRDAAFARELIAAGATRLGTSQGVALLA
jgi:deoxyribose-phosphate aldolase